MFDIREYVHWSTISNRKKIRPSDLITETVRYCMNICMYKMTSKTNILTSTKWIYYTMLNTVKVYIFFH